MIRSEHLAPKAGTEVPTIASQQRHTTVASTASTLALPPGREETRQQRGILAFLSVILDEPRAKDPAQNTDRLEVEEGG